MMDTMAEAVAALKRGELIGLPTETVYGLAADADQAAAVARIFALKGRPADHPLIVHLGEVEQLSEWAVEIPASAWKLARAFWPGPMTLILRRAARVTDWVTGGQDTVGLRIPSHPLALALLRQFGGGLAAPSANRFGRISPTTAAHVREEFGDALPIVLDGGECAVGIESTIIDLSGETIRVLRPGGLSIAAIEQLIGPMQIGAALHSPRVSGALASHYAPRTRLRVRSRERLQRQQDQIGLIVQRPLEGALHQIELGETPEHFAHGLYAAMRTLDAMGLAEIQVEAPPETQDWLAIRDRLSRAQAGDAEDAT